jgi:hypothetical protein
MHARPNARLSRSLTVSALFALAIATPASAQWSATILGSAPGPSATGSACTSNDANTQGGAYATLGGDHACIWSGTSASRIDLHPLFPGARSSSVYAVRGPGQVGSFEYFTGTGYSPKAALWSSTAGSLVVLHPGGIMDINNLARASFALAIDGSRQFGSSQVGSVQHAAAWTGTAVSYVDMHPPAVAAGNTSAIRGAGGGQQVGTVLVTSGSSSTAHASLWTGTAGSWVDLHPTGATFSNAYACDSAQQVGSASIPDGASAKLIACLWNGTGASFVNLNPPDALASEAFGVDGGVQVGRVAISPNASHAALWRGNANGWVDLHQYLPAGFGDVSVANSVKRDGTRIHVGGSARFADSFTTSAVLWTFVCPADFNNDNARSIDDIFIFINAWFAGDPRTDVDGNGRTIDDIFIFLNTWFAGC